MKPKKKQKRRKEVQYKLTPFEKQCCIDQVRRATKKTPSIFLDIL